MDNSLTCRVAVFWEDANPTSTEATTASTSPESTWTDTPSTTAAVPTTTEYVTDTPMSQGTTASTSTIAMVPDASKSGEQRWTDDPSPQWLLQMNTKRKTTTGTETAVTYQPLLPAADLSSTILPQRPSAFLDHSLFTNGFDLSAWRIANEAPFQFPSFPTASDRSSSRSGWRSSSSSYTTCVNGRCQIRTNESPRTAFSDN
ncbi:hypothetical protein BV898_18510 [Hypsibius exemplaris]|uniref:Uncharacterized protein n=1 Tax=Hypsibius exemplaris TaxID=2072580 RepID=A0A9X6NJU2_HYPEX|nr:hypothetical protein BV898_18510 [Hypsibius exemplaris]